MISYRAALEIISASIRPLPARQLTLKEAAGSIAASDVVSAVPVPSFANAAMDGFALRSADVRGASASTPVDLAIAGSIHAGQPPPGETAAGEAWEITTGAAMPDLCDAVVPIERAQRTGSTGSVLRIAEPVPVGQNRRDAGTDFAVGDRLLRAGDRLTPQAMMGLAAIGIDTLAVRSAPRIAVITTGAELASKGLPDDAGIIRDANAPYLEALFREIGVTLVARRTVGDEPRRLTAEIQALSPVADLILTTGGVSAGTLDFVPATVAQMGGRILFHKVAIRPGKPLLFASLADGTPLFGLPGNPMAVAVGLRFFVLPALRALTGQPAEHHLIARCAGSVRKREGLTFFAKASARVGTDAVLEVEVLPGQESFRINPLLRANCWAIVPEGTKDVRENEMIGIAPLLPGEFPGSSASIC